jgi:hypothetical protein
MAHFSRHSKEQSKCIDQVYAAMKQHEGRPVPSGQLTRDTGLDLNDIIGALEFLLEDGKIVMVPKTPEDRGDRYVLALAKIGAESVLPRLGKETK